MSMSASAIVDMSSCGDARPFGEGHLVRAETMCRSVKSLERVPVIRHAKGMALRQREAGEGLRERTWHAAHAAAPDVVGTESPQGGTGAAG